MPSSPSYAYLLMTSGPWLGAKFALDPAVENRIGRGGDCQILLDDPRCSRVHAVLTYSQAEGWWLRDRGSTNGTYVNNQKADEVRLGRGHVIRIGSVELEFHDERPAAGPAQPDMPGSHDATQTIVRQTPVTPIDAGGLALAALHDAPRAHDFLTLYQLALKLLGCERPDEVIAIALDILRERLQASLVGFLWIDDEGHLRPQLLASQASVGPMKLSDALTEMVCRQGRAVWIDTQATGRDAERISDFADALCVPLLHEQKTVGAIHAYLEHGRFDQNEFDFAISVANILAGALVRARRVARLAADHSRLVSKSAAFDELIGESRPMRDLKSKITRIARAAGCVLVRGESGAGKELVARAVHKASARADRPLLAVNCAALPRDLMESQLFGHKKGSFTGADSDHVGWFQQADSGTLFLDEVGEMTLEGQAKLLRILEGHPFLPVGGSKEQRVDVRVIAATNRDLAEFVREGRFRQDLYYRLSVFELYLPPLRERGEDVDLLIDHFLEHFKQQHGRPYLRLAEAAREKLRAYHWPGNVRQLRNVLDSAAVLADGDEIQPRDLGLRDVGGDQFESLDLGHWERKLIREAVDRAQGNVPEAAKLLGISRATLYRKIEEYGIAR